MGVRRMLVVTHDLAVGGAQMNALHLMRWLATNTDVELHTLSVGDGPLRANFESIAPVTVLEEHAWTRRVGTIQQGLSQIGSTRGHQSLTRVVVLPRLRSLRKFDVAYLATPASAGMLSVLPPAPVVISQVNQLQTTLGELWPPATRDAFMSVPDRWLARSGAVRDTLVDRLGLPADRVVLQPSFIDVAAFSERRITRREVERRRRELRLPEDASIVVGAGALQWQKGPHLFVQLAAEVNKQHREQVHFVWVGGHHEGIHWDRLAADIARAGIDKVHFVGEKQDPAPWFAMADVFALTSHEDGFPLTCLEHAAMGHPIVTFRNGGAPELLEAAGGDAARGVVDHLDVRAMARRIIELLGDVHGSARIGAQLRRTVTGRYDVDAGSRATWDLIGSLTA